MSLSFAKLGLGVNGGADPWSARDALVPLFLRRIRCLPPSKSRPGAGSGPGGPPHQLCRCALVGKLSGIGLKPAPPLVPKCVGWGGLQPAEESDDKNRKAPSLARGFLHSEGRRGGLAVRNAVC